MRVFLMICFIISSGFEINIDQGHEALYTIYFKLNSSQIDHKYETLLNKLAKTLSADSCKMIKMIGYADASGTKKYNDVISERRVHSVYNYLRLHGNIDSNKVNVQWQGESEEAYDLHLPKAHVLERAVDIRVIFRN